MNIETYNGYSEKLIIKPNTFLRDLARIAVAYCPDEPFPEQRDNVDKLVEFMSTRRDS